MQKLLVIVLLLGLVSIGCVQTPPLAPADEGKTTASKATTTSSRPAWEQRWNDLAAAARKEGQLAIFGSVSGALRNIGLDKHLDQKFGLGVEFVGGKASEILPKLLATYRAGLYVGDIFILSPTTGMNQLKPAGVTEPLDQVIFLPEALDPKAYYKGELPWVDKDHHQLAMLAMPVAPIVINTDMVKPDEIKSYRDLLNPKWKGKIVMVDPTGAGAGNDWFSAMAEGIMDLNYLREFARQETVINRDSRLMAEWIARGRYPIIVGLKRDEVAEFQRVGAPIQMITPQEGTYVGTDSGGLVLLKNAAHPNASKLFVNWVMTREGQEFISRAYGGQSARVDVPTDFIDAKQVRQPGMNYLNTTTEEYALKLPGYYKVAAEMFASSLK
ncbi:MAG: extracellular solute-binding protein [Chloroflexi bacterium]|nr:extracellular solute-binding protein [Chloroflexota bacterium]